MKKVVVISASLRHGSNSAVLAGRFADGAREAGNEVEVISLTGKKLGFCVGCMACQKTNACWQKDDAAAIAAKVCEADVVCFATPVYYYSICGQLKTLFDRMNPLYTADYAFRSVYLLATAADDAENAVDGSVKAVQGWVDCFEKAELSGVVFGAGIDDPEDAVNHEDVLRRAYEAGRNC